jgi:sugar (pentulose or hexulose) kinase
LAQPVYLGIDIGTSGCRVAAIDDAETLIGYAEAALPQSARPGGGRVEQEPEAWWQALTEALQELLRHLPAETEPAAVSVDGTSGTVLLTEADGRPLSPGVMYDDVRGRPHLRRIGETAPREAAVHGTGASLPKALSLLAERSPGSDCRVLHQSEWLTGRLLADYRYGDENNCLKLGYDPVERTWPDWLVRLLPAQMLPEVAAVGSPLGGVSTLAARDTALPVGLPVIAGTTDSTAACLAAGAKTTGDAVTSLGSTLVVKLLSDRPLFAPEYGIYSHRVLGQWLTGGASNSGGRVLRRYFSDRQMRALTPRLRPDEPTGLDYYPLLERGERFPLNDPDLEPRLTPTPADPAQLFQALLEGIARIEAAGYRLLDELGAGLPRRIFTSGGGARNPAWRRIRERMLGVPIVSARQSHAAYGAALIARRGVDQRAGDA